MVTSFGQDIFFNEVKYEAPNGEQFLEVAGPTGDDITGWQIILYDSLAAPYDTITLDEEFPETQACNGIIIVDVPVLFTTPGSCLLYTSPSPRDQRGSRMPSSA